MGRGARWLGLAAVGIASLAAATAFGVPSGAGGTATAYAQAVLANNPTSYYRFDESSGPLATDSSGNGHTATYQSNVQFGAAGAFPSESDAAISTTASGDAVTESGVDLPAGATARTLEAWVKYACCFTAFDLMRYGDITGGKGFEVQLGDNADTIVAKAGAATVSVPQVGDYRNGWHLIDVTYDGSTATIYEDGQILGSGSLGTAATVTPGQGLRISSRAAGMGLDEVAVYPSALSATSIEAHWTAAESTAQIAACTVVPANPYPSAVLADGPVMAFRLDERGPSPSGRVAVDYSSHCANGAYHRSPTAVSGALTGDPDGAVAATARDIVLAQTGGSLPAGSAPRTVEAWVQYACCNAAFDLLRYGDVPGGKGFELQLSDNADTIAVTAGGSTVSASSVGDYRHGWHLIDATYNGSGVSIYQDGQLIGGGTLGVIATVTPGQGLRVAANAAGAALDEVAIYPVALSATRVLAHFTASTMKSGKPSATISKPLNGSIFAKGQVVNASFSCTPGASGGTLKAGTAGCSGTVANGSPINTSTTGNHSFTVTATDTDNQTTTVTNNYSVAAPQPQSVTCSQTSRPASPANNLSGVWKSNQSGKYYVRQIGSCLYWVGLGTYNATTHTYDYANAYFGKVSTTATHTITGPWFDVNAAASSVHGQLALKVVSATKLTTTSSMGGLTATSWTKQSTSAYSASGASGSAALTCDAGAAAAPAVNYLPSTVAYPNANPNATTVRYNVRQIGSCVVFWGRPKVSPVPSGWAYSPVFFGKSTGSGLSEVVNGVWADVPAGTRKLFGKLTLKVTGTRKFTASGTGGWTTTTLYHSP